MNIYFKHIINVDSKEKMAKYTSLDSINSDGVNFKIIVVNFNTLGDRLNFIFTIVLDLQAQ